MTNKAVELIAMPKKNIIDQERVFQNGDTPELMWTGEEMDVLSNVVILYGQHALPGKVFFWHFVKQVSGDGDVEYCAQTQYPPLILPVKLQAWDPWSLAIKLADFYISVYSTSLIDSFELVRSTLVTSEVSAVVI